MATPIPGKFRIDDAGKRVPVYADPLPPAGEGTNPPDDAPISDDDGVTGDGVAPAGDPPPGKSETPVNPSARRRATQKGGNK